MIEDLANDERKLLGFICDASQEKYPQILREILTYLKQREKIDLQYQQVLLIGLCLQDHLPLTLDFLPQVSLASNCFPLLGTNLKFRITLFYLRYCWEKFLLKPVLPLLIAASSFLAEVMDSLAKSTIKRKKKRVFIIGRPKPKKLEPHKFQENDISYCLVLLQKVALLFHPSKSLHYASLAGSKGSEELKALAHLRECEIASALQCLGKMRGASLSSKLMKQMVALLTGGTTVDLDSTLQDLSKLEPHILLLVCEISLLSQVKERSVVSSTVGVAAQKLLKEALEEKAKVNLSGIISKVEKNSALSIIEALAYPEKPVGEAPKSTVFITKLFRSKTSTFSLEARLQELQEAFEIFSLDSFVTLTLLELYEKRFEEQELERTSKTVVEAIGKLRNKHVFLTSPSLKKLEIKATEFYAQSLCFKGDFTNCAKVLHRSPGQSPLLELLLGEAYRGLGKDSSAFKTFSSFLLEGNFIEKELKEFALHRMLSNKMNNFALAEAKNIMHSSQAIAMDNPTLNILQTRLGQEEALAGNFPEKTRSSRTLSPRCWKGESWYDLLFSLSQQGYHDLVLQLSPVLLSLYYHEPNALLLVANSLLAVNQTSKESVRVAQHLLLKALSLQKETAFDALEALTRLFLKKGRGDLAQTAFGQTQERTAERWMENWLLTGLVDSQQARAFTAFRCGIESSSHKMDKRGIECCLRYLLAFMRHLRGSGDADPPLWRLAFQVAGNLLRHPNSVSFLEPSGLKNLVQECYQLAGKRIGVLSAQGVPPSVKDIGQIEAVRLCPWDAKSWVVTAQSVPDVHRKLFLSNALVLREASSSLSNEEDFRLLCSQRVDRSLALRLYMLCPWKLVSQRKSLLSLC